MNKLLDAKLNLFTKCRILKNDLKPILRYVLHSQQNIYGRFDG